MSNKVLSFLLLLLMVSVSYAANVTISAGECYTVNENLSVCTPGFNLNETQIYRSCIDESRAVFNLTPVLSVVNTQSNLTEDLRRVLGTANFTFVNEYASCAVQLNISKSTAETCGDRLRNFSYENDVLRIKVGSCESDANQTNDLRFALKTEQDNRNMYIVGGLVVGVVAYHFWRNSQKKEGRPMMPGTSPKQF